MGQGFPCLMFPISRCTDRCFPPIQTTRCGRSRFRSSSGEFIPLNFMGAWLFNGGMLNPLLSLELTYPLPLRHFFESIIFPFVQVGYARFLPWRVYIFGVIFFWSMGIRCVSGWCILESIVVLVKKCQAKAPRSYPRRFHARHASHAHQQKENTKQRKNDKIFPVFFWRKPTWIFNFHESFQFLPSPPRRHWHLMLILKCWWRWSLRSGWCVECDGLMGSLRSGSWWVLMVNLIGKLCDPWGKLMISLMMIFCWWVPKYHCRMRRSGVGFFPGFSEGSWWGRFCAFERDMCVCVVCLVRIFLGLFFMSYLDSGLLFDNNLGKTQLQVDKIGVICQLLGCVSGLDYFSDFHIVVCIIREYICQNIMAKSKVL